MAGVGAWDELQPTRPKASLWLPGEQLFLQLQKYELHRAENKDMQFSSWSPLRHGTFGWWLFPVFLTGLAAVTLAPHQGYGRSEGLNRVQHPSAVNVKAIPLKRTWLDKYSRNQYSLLLNPSAQKASFPECLSRWCVPSQSFFLWPNFAGPTWQTGRLILTKGNQHQKQQMLFKTSNEMVSTGFPIH